MAKTPITASQALELCIEFSTEDLVVDNDYLRERGFEIVNDVAGSANAAAAPAAPVYDEELLALVEGVRAKSHTKTKTGKALKTSDGRPKAILGKGDGIGNYKVTITGTK